MHEILHLWYPISRGLGSSNATEAARVRRQCRGFLPVIVARVLVGATGTRVTL